MSISKAKKIRDVVYPDTDGKPMAESDIHRDWMMDIIQRLQHRYAAQDVYVSGNLLIYYEEGNPKKSVAPDAFVVKDCRAGRRRVFKIWEEKRTPNFILETTSQSTKREDLVKKKDLYKKLQVPDYFLFDPLGEWLDPPLQGFRLVNGEYEAIAPDADGGLVSQELGIRFVVKDGDLLMFDAKTGEPVLTKEEARAEEQKRRAQEEYQRAEEERRRADEAEKRAKQLEAELMRVRDLRRKPNGERGNHGES